MFTGGTYRCLPSINGFPACCYSGHYDDSVCLQKWSRCENYQHVDRNNLPAVKNNQVYELPEARYWVLRSDRIQGQAEDFADMIVERTQQNPQVNSIYKIIQHDRTLCLDRP